MDGLNYYTREQVDSSFTLHETKLTDLSNNIDVILTQDVIFSGDKTFQDNIRINGILEGPSDFYIDPAPYGSDISGGRGGTVIIRGNLQVDGSYTIIDSTRLDISDTNIMLASNATELSQSDGAGIQIMDASGPSIVYKNPEDNWVFNRDISAQDISASNIECTNLAIKDVSNLNINTDVIIHKTIYAKKFIFSKHI